MNIIVQMWCNQAKLVETSEIAFLDTAMRKEKFVFCFLLQNYLLLVSLGPINQSPWDFYQIKLNRNNGKFKQTSKPKKISFLTLDSFCWIASPPVSKKTIVYKTEGTVFWKVYFLNVGKSGKKMTKGTATTHWLLYKMSVR